MIKVKNLSVGFEGKIVLDDVSCRIEKGKITSIIGKSGMGKSVLMKAILGLLPYQAGEVEVDGFCGRKELKSLRSKMAMLFQNSALFDSLDVFQNISFPVFEQTKKPYHEIREKAKEMLTLVNLPISILENYPAELSGGMRKRVALARAIIQEPEYLIYDEPTTGLDPITGDDIIKLIGDIHKKLDMTSIVITHDPECIKTLTESLIMIDDKKVIFCDSFENFMEFSHPTAVSFKNHIFRVG
jgi:phospholipid/cholesterol/gamma-HCH transport system ATP-binding protein